MVLCIRRGPRIPGGQGSQGPKGSGTPGAQGPRGPGALAPRGPGSPGAQGPRVPNQTTLTHEGFLISEYTVVWGPRRYHFVFFIFICFFGPGRVRKRSGGGFRFIWTKFQPKSTILDPFGVHFSLSIFQKPIWAPNSSAVVPYALWILDILIPWVHVGRRPTLMEAEGRL